VVPPPLPASRTDLRAAAGFGVPLEGFLEEGSEKQVERT